MSNKPYYGINRRIKAVEHCVEIVAAESCPVLLLGETGTGKGMVARQIHECGPLKDKAFVDVNCSGLKGELLKSELFGHVKGAYTGAISDRRGLIEEANGGTLFLDEIGEMDIGVQCQLLKAIEEKTYRRVGDTESHESNFRLICATSRDLSKAMSEGKFLKDLYYRINTYLIYIPALRTRLEDIPGLMNYLLMKMDYKHFPVSDDVIKVLLQCRWHGNIREFRNTLERALVFARGKPLAPEHFANIFDEDIPQVSIDVCADPMELYTANFKNVWNLDILEEEYIRRAIVFFKNDKTKASQALGISLSCLYRKLHKMREDGNGNGDYGYGDAI